MALDELIEKVNEDRISRRGVIKIGIAVGAGLAGATIAGCTSPTPTPSGTITPLPTVTPTPGPVLKGSGVGYLPSDHHAPLFVAASKGTDGKAQSIFEKHGLTVSTQLMTAGPTIMSQLSANKIDIALAGVAPTITQIDGDPTIKIVAGVQSNGSGILVGKNAGIAKIDDLEEAGGLPYRAKVRSRTSCSASCARPTILTMPTS